MDDPNITMEEYIRLEEEKARRRGQVYNWEKVTYGKIWYDKDVHYLRSFEKEFPAIILRKSSQPLPAMYALTSDFSPEPTVSPQHIDEFDETSLSECDDEGQKVIYFNDLFPSNIIYPDDLSDKDNDNDKIDIKHSLGDLSIELLPNSFGNMDLGLLLFVEIEFSCHCLHDALTFKLDLLTEPTIIPRHIDEFDLKDETSLPECDEKEQNVLYFNDLLPFNVIYPEDLKSDTDNDNDKIDSEQPSGDMSIIPSPNDLAESNST
ncbi:hypothetical protein Tco_0462631 [Tanacetum coccineum]